jgi:hypothetical protein
MKKCGECGLEALHPDDECCRDCAGQFAAVEDANAEHEAQILEIEAALGGCRPPLVEGSRVGNILAYIVKLQAPAGPQAGWQPIETAPKDKRIMLLLGTGWATFGAWNGAYSRFLVESNQGRVTAPTHWQAAPGVRPNPKD